MRLKGRLGLIAEKIPRCGILADIGTDHAHIPVFAVLNGICEKAVATDIKRGPVDIAKKNIRRHGLQEKIETRLGNGLEPINGQKVDVIVIAGMGGTLMQEILSAGYETAWKAGLLILQPMNAIELVRKWLNENGFGITDEALAREGNKIYNIICAKWTGTAEKLDEFYNYLGFVLINGTDPHLKYYLEKKLKQFDIIIDGKKKAQNIQEDITEFIIMRDRLKKLLHD